MLSLRCNILISIRNHMIRPLKFLSLFLDHLNIILIVLSTHLSDELLRMHTKMSDCSTSWEHRRRRSSSCCGNKNSGCSVRCTTVQLYIFSASSRWGKRQERASEGKPSLVREPQHISVCMLSRESNLSLLQPHCWGNVWRCFPPLQRLWSSCAFQLGGPFLMTKNEGENVSTLCSFSLILGYHLSQWYTYEQP